MSIEYMTRAFKTQLRPASYKFVLVALADNADSETGECWPSVRTLTRKTCLDRKTVLKALRSLSEDGFLHDTGKRVGHTGRVSVLKLKLNSPKNGTITNVQIVPKTAPLNSPKNGTIKQSQKRHHCDGVPLLVLNRHSGPSASTPCKSPKGDKRKSTPRKVKALSIPKEQDADLRLMAEELYKAYPKKDERPESIREIINVLKTGVDSEWLFERVEKFAALWQSSDKQFCRSARRWFRNRCFNDPEETWELLARGNGNGHTHGAVTKQPTFFELEKVVKLKEDRAKGIRDRYAAEVAAGLQWSDTKKREEYLALRTEIKNLKARLETMFTPGQAPVTSTNTNNGHTDSNNLPLSSPQPADQTVARFYVADKP